MALEGVSPKSTTAKKARAADCVTKWDGDACGSCEGFGDVEVCSLENSLVFDDLASGVVSVLMELFSVGTWMIPCQDLLGS